VEKKEKRRVDILLKKKGGRDEKILPRIYQVTVEEGKRGKLDADHLSWKKGTTGGKGRGKEQQLLSCLHFDA